MKRIFSAVKDFEKRPADTWDWKLTYQLGGNTIYIRDDEDLETALVSMWNAQKGEARFEIRDSSM